MTKMLSRTVTITLSEKEFEQLVNKHSLALIMVRTGMRELDIRDAVLHQIISGKRLDTSATYISDPSVIDGTSF